MRDQKILNGLIDFSDLRKKTQDFHSNSSKKSISNNLDIDCQNHEQIMKSFKELRDKLKTANKENQCLREQMNMLQIQNKQIMQSQTNLLSINHQLKQKMNWLQQASDQFKRKISIMKEQLSQKSAIQGQLQYLKQNLIDYKMCNDRLQQQKKKLIQISIEQKMNLQQQINKLQLKRQKEDKYLNQIQLQLNKSKEIIMKLENQLKKMEIKFDQEMFDKKWNKNNFQKEYYQKNIEELNNQILELKNKNKKQKEKRVSIQQRVLELEEISGLWNIKAEAYEGEVQIMSKKVKKMEKRMSQAKTTANKMVNQRVSFEQKFYKCSQMLEELINRVKRQLIGDVVELAKSCQYRLNKIKQNDKSQFSKINSRQNRSISLGKNNLTEKKVKKNQDLFENTMPKMQVFKKVEVQQNKMTILLQKDINKGSSILNEGKGVFKTISNKENQQKQLQIEYSNLQNKIRRQRDEMERKLKEKMLYRKIQVSSSPQKNKLREDYLNFMIRK